MADILGQFYRASKVREGTSPSSPGVIVGEPVNPVNPIGSNQSYLTLTDTNDSSYIGKDGFVPIVVGESGLTLVPLPQIQENGLISGGIVQWTGIGYVFNVSGAFYRIGGVLYESQPIQITLATPDVTNDRIDVFAVDINGVALDITGTPSGSPVKPQVDPQTQLELTSVIVTASTTTPTLTEEVIYDENVEWTGSNSGTGTVAFNSAVDPYQGSLSINATNIQNGLKIRLTDGSDYDLSTVQTLGFQINLKATMGAGLNIGVTFLNSSGSPISTELILSHNKSLLGYQFVGIALSQFSFTSFLARSIEFRYIRTKGTIIYSGFYLDIIKLEGGINPPQTVGSFLGLSDTPTSYSGQAGKTVAVKADESGLEFVTGGGGASTFLALTDTPSTYSGQANKWTRVNGGETALVFDTVSPYDLDQEGATDGQVVTWVASNSRYEPVTFAGSSNWTVSGSDIYRNSKVTIGDTTIINADFGLKQNSTVSAFTLNCLPSSTQRDVIKIVDGSINRFVLNNYGQPVFSLFNGSIESGSLTFSVLGTGLGLLVADTNAFTAANRAGINFYPLITAGGSESIGIYARNTVRFSISGTGRVAFNNASSYAGATSFTFGGVSGDTIIAGFYLSGLKFTIFTNGNLGIFDSGNFVLGTTTGSKIGTATNQKISFWNKTPIIQPTTAITGATRVGGGGTTITDTDTFGGYTIAKIAAALINTGILA